MIRSSGTLGFQLDELGKLLGMNRRDRHRTETPVADYTVAQNQFVLADILVIARDKPLPSSQMSSCQRVGSKSNLFSHFS